jgi:hypothetical protein
LQKSNDVISNFVAVKLLVPAGNNTNPGTSKLAGHNAAGECKKNYEIGNNITKKSSNVYWKIRLSKMLKNMSASS